MEELMIRKHLKKMASVVLTASMILGMAGIAFAKNTKTVVQNVKISINYDLAPNMSTSNIDVDSDSPGVDGVTVSSVTNTDYGKKPKVTLKVKPDSDFTFKGTPAGNVTLEDKTGKGATITKVSSSSGNMSITVTLPKTSSGEEGGLEVSDISWGDDDSPIITWDSASYAKQYEVKLYRNNVIKDTISTTATSYDFRSKIRENGKGNYTVKIRAIASNGSKGKWTESDEFDVDEDVLANLGGQTGSGGSPSGSGSGTGAWLKDNVGWWYINADRTYTTNNWQQINGNWYYFDNRGYMVTGWLKSPYSGKWYWLSTENNSNLGKMLTNQWVDNNRYYVDGSGVWTQSR